MRLTPAVLLSAALALTAATAARAQQPADGVITAMGQVTLKRTPDTLRMQILVSAEGKTLKDALAKLQQRRDAAKAKLATLGAAEASVTFSDPQPEATDPRRQQMIMMQRMRGSSSRPGAAAKPAAAPPVRVQATLKAEWPLAANAKSADDVLLAAQEIQDKVRAADLAQTKAASLEEQENREENAANAEMSDDPSAAPPGEPGFLFVSKIPAADRAKATADAFAKAKASAAELAAAANATLGPVKQITGGPSAVDPEQMQYLQYARFRGGFAMPTPGEDDPAQSEAIGTYPGAVALRVMVSASFALK